MAGKAFTSATLSFKGSTAQLKSMTFNEDGNAVDVTTLQDAAHVFQKGIPVEEITCEVGGYSTWAVNSSGALVASWDGSNSDTISTALLATKEFSGELDGELTTSLTFRRSD
jgi:hypothetical protein